MKLETMQYDVVVVGGGTAGVIAAIAAANEGASVALIEQFGALGGSSTGALVTPTMNTHVEGVPMNSYIVTELDRLAEERGAMLRRGVSRYYDPILLPVVLEEMAVDAGVSLYLYTDLIDVAKEGDRISGIFVAGYLVVWAIIYAVTKRNTEKINQMLKQKQQRAEET